jgi:uncharacterized protein (TIGR02145 family)
MKKFTFRLLAAVAALSATFTACEDKQLEQLISVVSVTLDRTSAAMIVGDTLRLMPTVLPENASKKTVSWASSNPAVATVANGTVIAKAAGTANIAATTQDGNKTASCAVTVSAASEPNVPVTSVSLSQNATTLTVGDTLRLTATVLPANATNKAVTWASSNPAVATVSNGLITALATGTANIAATTQDGNKTAACAVTVNASVVSVTSVSLSQNAATLTIGDTQRLTATVLPENASNKSVTWTSSNTAVATVNNGLITTLTVGTANITVTSQDGNKTATCALTVNPVPVTSVTLSQTTASLFVGDAQQLTATVQPSDATNKTVTWASSDPAVATVANGLITALTVGTANITVTTQDGNKSATCAVTVNPIAVTSVSLNQTTATLALGDYFTLTPTVLPANATNKNVSWASSNTDVATVGDGMVFSYWSGTATITVTTQDGNKTATCIITVPNLMVDGIRWADINVDDYQTFASRPDTYTKLYQWNKSRAWAATGSVSGWSSADITDPEWTINPCPAGWRLPTREEFTALINAGSISGLKSTWAAANTRGNAVAGRFFGPFHSGCTLPNNMTECIFLPAVGWRDWWQSSNNAQDNEGSYWSSTQSDNYTQGYDLHFSGGNYSSVSVNYKANGYSIRCVQ